MFSHTILYLWKKQGRPTVQVSYTDNDKTNYCVDAAILCKHVPTCKGYSIIKKIKKRKHFVIQTKTSTEWITEVMSQAAKEPQQDGTSQHLLS